MPTELTETQRIPLTNEDRHSLTQVVIHLKELRARYGEQSLSLHQTQRKVAQLQAELDQVEEKTASVLAALEEEISKTTAELQACSKELTTKYNIDPDVDDDSVWALRSQNQRRRRASGNLSNYCLDVWNYVRH